MSKATMAKLNGLHDMIATHMTKQLEEGEMEAKDIANVLKFLKDNDITAEVSESKPIQSLVDQFLMNKDDLQAELEGSLQK